jgi:D-alanyl-D-alanine carboxypeptidase (penicillin-binding protein 5/6)
MILSSFGVIGSLFLAATFFSSNTESGSNQVRTTEPLIIDEVQSSSETLPSEPIAVWPKEGQAAIGGVGYGVVSSSPSDERAIPMASLSKVMAALLIMEKDGVTLESEGKSIFFSADDEQFYNKYLFEGGVVTRVESGGFISQRDGLKAMLIGSSNNLADTSVIASFGSIDAYLLEANKKAQQLGMSNTVFADATGFSKDSIATASDLVLLANYAMQNSLFANIVSTWKTTVLDTEIVNTNAFLDFEGNNVIGIKSGLTDEAGGTFMTAARYVDSTGEEMIATAVILGAKTHFNAQQDAMPLLTSIQKTLN